ncbi:MAG: YebC/PmpR family DNA-binding transcriptional regulator [Patescibacteria group bacterium]|nr:YebC/PmpR family DNA-binding transcriptional regulator [Patescibacteria group bacterium]
MSGHSKWANIKRKKEANDKVKGNIFGKLSRIITLAVIEGGGITDPSLNTKLRLAIEKAQSFNMPKENIKRAIERGLGPQKDQLKEVIYEGFGPYGVSLLILATTDNPNRTFSELRANLERNGGKLAQSGAVSYQFKKCGFIVFNKKDFNQEEIFQISDKIEAFDIDEDEEKYYLYFPYEFIGHIKERLGEIKYEKLEIDFKPQIKVSIDDENKINEIFKLIDFLESSDDIQKVFTNIG